MNLDYLLLVQVFKVHNNLILKLKMIVNKELDFLLSYFFGESQKKCQTH